MSGWEKKKSHFKMAYIYLDVDMKQSTTILHS